LTSSRDEGPPEDLTEKWNEDQAAEVEAMQPERTPCEYPHGSLVEVFRARMQAAELEAGLLRQRLADMNTLVDVVLRMPKCTEQHYVYKPCLLCAAKRLARESRGELLAPDEIPF
jgi:hypothetical protein